MGTQGLVFKDMGQEPSDLLPVPETNPTAHEGRATTLIDPTVYEGRATTLTDMPTESHALAMEAAKATDPTEAGAAQVQHAEEVVDLGWNEPKELIAKPLVGGLSNEDLWLLVRRFNKVRLWNEILGDSC
jgi:hypothetical protein